MRVLLDRPGTCCHCHGRAEQRHCGASATDARGVGGNPQCPAWRPNACPRLIAKSMRTRCNAPPGRDDAQPRNRQRRHATRNPPASRQYRRRSRCEFTRGVRPVHQERTAEMGAHHQGVGCERASAPRHILKTVKDSKRCPISCCSIRRRTMVAPGNALIHGQVDETKTGDHHVNQHFCL